MRGMRNDRKKGAYQNDMLLFNVFWYDSFI